MISSIAFVSTCKTNESFLSLTLNPFTLKFELAFKKVFRKISLYLLFLKITSTLDRSLLNLFVLSCYEPNREDNLDFLRITYQ